MVSSFDELTNTEVKVENELLQDKINFDKIFFNAYNTVEGRLLFSTLRERHVETAIYNKGDTLEAVAYRQGMCDLVLQMEQCVRDIEEPNI